MPPAMRAVGGSIGRSSVAALLALAAFAVDAQTAGPVGATTGPIGATASGNAAGVAPPPSAPNTAESARYVESCQQGIERGVVNPGCQGPIYANEIERLKEDALRTNNANLLTLVGDAYLTPRGSLSDIGQAYRWYLLAAVRGDPRAMQRLSELYKNGRGTPQDNIKALGYARLTQRLALPGGSDARRATETISVLGSEMAAEEVALAERFADELERNIQGRVGISSPLPAAPTQPPTPPPSGVAARKPLSGLPGLGAAQPGESNQGNVLPPAAGVPGLERAPEPQRQP